MSAGFYYGRKGVLTQGRKDRRFLANGGLVSFIALSELRPTGQRYWVLRDMFERISGLVVVRG